MVGPNVKTLRSIKKKNGEQWAQLQALVPPTTLRRHLEGKQLPTSIWMARYRLALGLEADQWLSTGAYKKEAKKTHALAYAGLLPHGEAGGL